MNLFAIDPEKHTPYVSVFIDGKLIDVADMADWTFGPFAGVTRIVVEIPRSYPQDPRKANDLIDIAASGFWLAGQIKQACTGPVDLVRRTPQEWKGSVKKPIHHMRALKKLTPAELGVLQRIKPDVWEHVAQACERLTRSKKVTDYSNVIHNHLDAVALGLTELGRM